MFRKYTIALLLAAALSIAPRASAQEVRWHPYALSFTATGAVLIADTKRPDGYETKDACDARKEEILASLVAEGAKVLGRCTTNDEQAEIAAVNKLLGATPGTEI